jgi:hypothetical protein
MKRYRHHRYEYSKPFMSPRHSWELIGPRGGIHFHVSLTPGYDPSCGLEIHYARGFQPNKDEPPSQCPCWLLKEPCWHDGTSLYASEQLWPMIEPYLKRGDHDQVFAILEREADDRFGHGHENEDEGAA